ncbi:MAG TPA: hypothetical protein VFL16_15945 [Steroidobacteraceae bacterium]|nr:hypothetical protein [Steroidobacteraceae bacterium]
MTAAVRTWAFLLLSLGYLLTAHYALSRQSAAGAAMASGLLVALAVAMVRGRHRHALRALVAAVGAAIVVWVARGAPPVPLMLPPILVPAGVALLFGRSLLPGSMPLVERLARAFYAPDEPSPGIPAYARSVTWAWTLLLAALALVNAILLACLQPGGLLQLAGFVPRWPVPPSSFAWFTNTGTYLLIGGMFAAEFAVRIWRFPDYRYRNPLRFIREARARMPQIRAALRHG